MIIVKKNYDSIHVSVLFLNTNSIKENVVFSNFKSGRVKNPFSPNVYGVAYVGNVDTKIKGEHYKSYICWRAMISRCYNPKDKSYKWYGDKGCVVCKEWLCFSNFKKWYDENFYSINGRTTNLDKDIINKHNTIYSPNNCIFVPDNINKAILSTQKMRGDLPIGVYYSHFPNKPYAAQICYGNGISKQLGSFMTCQEAFLKYKKEKEKFLRFLAEENKEKIPKKLYDALMNYTIDITD